MSKKEVIKEVITHEEKETIKRFAETISPKGWIFSIENNGYYPESDEPNAVLVALDIRGREDEEEHHLHGATRNFEYFHEEPHMTILLHATFWDRWKKNLIYQLVVAESFVRVGKELELPSLKNRVHSWEVRRAMERYPKYYRMVNGDGKGKLFKEIAKEFISRGIAKGILKEGEIKTV